MRQQLKDIADIRTGHTFRGKVPEDPKGNSRVLQIKDMRGKMVITSDTLTLINAKAINKTSHLEPDDVIIPARGDHYNAAIFKPSDDSNTDVVASNQVLIIRVNKSKIIPDYICWYLNQNEAKNYIKNEIRGTNIPMITKDSLSRLMIKIPPIEIQKKIVELVNLWQKEKQLTQKLMNNREDMLKGMFQQLLEQ
jgi:restriction endonuclease S subunit